jgi:hypothetical protein
MKCVDLEAHEAGEEDQTCAWEEPEKAPGFISPKMIMNSVRQDRREREREILTRR